MNLWLMMHDFIRLTTVILSSNYSQTKKKPLSDESSTIVRRIKLCITSIKSLHTTHCHKTIVIRHRTNIFLFNEFCLPSGIQWSKSFCIDIRIFSRKDNKKYYKLGKSYKAMVKRVLLFRNYICILYWNSQETIEFPRINSCFNAYKI